MKRKDFLKSCCVLGVVPFLPRFGQKEKFPLWGCGFRHKRGICYGFRGEENEGEVEVVIFDYQRIPYDKKELKNIGERVDFSKFRWAKNEREYFANEEAMKKLIDYMNRSCKKYGYPDSDDVLKYDKVSRRRIKKWAKRLSDRFDSII